MQTRYGISRDRELQGTIDELVDLFLNKIHYGALTDEQVLSRKRWLPAQVQEAREQVRYIEAHGLDAPNGYLPPPDAYIQPHNSPDKAYHSLLDGFLRLCAHDPQQTEKPNLFPAPEAVARDSGNIAFRVGEGLNGARASTWTLHTGDTLIVEVDEWSHTGDLVLLATKGGELRLGVVRDNSKLASLFDGADDMEPADCVSLGVVVELRTHVPRTERRPK